MEPSVNDWVVIGQNGCQWCDKALLLLKGLGIEPLYLNASDHPVLKEFLGGNGLRTVPQVFRNGDRIGGFEQLSKLLNK